MSILLTWSSQIRRWSVAVAAIAFVLVLMSSAAQALQVVGYAEGRINDFWNEVRGEGVDVFDLTTEELLGQAARIDFAYDTARVPAEQGRFLGRRQYETNGGIPLWLEMSVTVNGRTFETGSTRQYADLIGGFDDGSGSPDMIQLSAEHHEDVEFGNRRDFIELMLDLPVGSIPFEGLPTRIERVVPVDQAVNGVTVSINDFAFDGAGGALLYERFVNFHLDIEAFEIQPVPEPGTALLLGMGLTILSIRRARASRTRRTEGVLDATHGR